MLWVMISKGYFLVRRKTVKESSSFYSMVSSTMRRFYLRTCEKTMLSLHLVSSWSGSVEVRHSQWVFCTGLLRLRSLLVCGSSCLGRTSFRWSAQKWIWPWGGACSWNPSWIGVVWWCLEISGRPHLWISSRRELPRLTIILLIYCKTSLPLSTHISFGLRSVSVKTFWKA